MSHIPVVAIQRVPYVLGNSDIAPSPHASKQLSLIDIDTILIQNSKV